MRAPLLSIAAGALATLAGCAEHGPTEPLIRPDLAPSSSVTSVTTPTSGPWARVVEGKTGPGSLYAIYVPRAEQIKGVVYYAHGVRPPLAPITLDNGEERGQDKSFDVADALGAQGYAFVFSSFSENGLAIKDGAQRTHQLRGLVAAELGGEPERSYLMGYSLGALIALNLAERFPTQYDGVLAACGMIGGTPRELQYVGDVRALFDAFYPGALPGNAISVPSTPLTLDEVKVRVVTAISPPPVGRGPLGLFAIASTAQTPLAFAPVGSLTDPSSMAFQSLVGSLITALYYQLLGTPDVVERTHGHSPYENRGTTYALGRPVLPGVPFADIIRAVNAGVQRFDMTPDARNYLEKYYVPTGHLQIPVVSVHNFWDPLVPYFHEPAFAQTVAAAGASDMLWQQGVPNYGHCNFQTSLVVGSFGKLVNWVENGVKPN
jgi:pimeloyl-ACP methyl ester carboxylesterase